MTQLEVSEPILNSPYDEPTKYWHIVEGESPRMIEGARRPSFYFFRPDNKKDDSFGPSDLTVGDVGFSVHWGRRGEEDAIDVV